MGLGAVGAAFGDGLAGNAFISGVARQPEAQGRMIPWLFTIVGLVEAMYFINKEAEAKLNEARRTAQTVVDAAAKSAEQVRQELKQKAEDEARRIRESTLKEIEAERLKAIQSVRGEVAGLVVAATEKVIGETLDLTKHKQLIDRAIQEVASGDGSR
jgi:ATP synthase F0 subunit b